MKQSSHGTRFAMAASALLLAASLFAQVTPAAGVSPPDDKPSYKVGALIFGDYTYFDSPKAMDAEGNSIHNSSFNISRAYINITGNLNHDIAFRITPDIARETGTGSSLNGSYTFRLKYAYAQLNLDDWTTKGSWVRVGLQQTPFLDYAEGIYRYRFQGTTFVDREGEFPSADSGISGHYNFAGNYGDVHAGVYNGEGYNKVETNNEKAFQVRGTVRPMPLGGPWLKGLRVTGFLDEDHYAEGAKRQREVGQVTYESSVVNVGAEYLRAKDQTLNTKPEISSKGYSIWATPKLGGGWEILLRHDQLQPNDSAPQKHHRDIAGLAYWLPKMDKVSSAVLVDYDSLKQDNPTTTTPDDTRYGLKFLISF